MCFNPEEPDKPCPICGGIGMVKLSVPVDDKRFGKLFRCPNNPQVVDGDRQERLRRLSNLDQFADKTFDTFYVDEGEKSDVESLTSAFDLANAFVYETDRWLLLEGPYGCGKTHLAAAIGNARLANGQSVFFITSPDLLDYLRSSFGQEADETYDTLFERIKAAEFLIIDDLGVENPSAWAQEKLFQLLNHRYVHRKQTVITTNARVADMDGRLRSRLLDADVVYYMTINAPDYRTREQKLLHDPILANLLAYNQLTFENFEIEPSLPIEQADSLRKVFRMARDHARNPQKPWMIITSPSKEEAKEDLRFGNGKTHLAASIVNYRDGEGDKVILGTVPDLMDYLRESFAGSSSYHRRFEILRSIGMLMIDDLKTDGLTSWSKEKIFQILDYRYVRKLPTVITLPDLSAVEPRLRFKLLDKRVCHLLKIQVEAYALRRRRLSE
jgi:DNA replication protein DnaC